METVPKPATTTPILVASEHGIMQRLAERRITPEVITTFQIEPRGTGWVYNTPRGASRFKNADSEATNKYAWIGRKRDTLLYAFDLREAIQQANGNVWLTTEFDLFAMRSAGIYHVIAQLQGEGSVPDELPSMLQSLDVSVCHIAPDRDTQGATWAQSVANKLALVNIDVYARELPFRLEAKKGGDIGKVWQGYSDSQPFERYLLNLPVTKLEAELEIKRINTQVPAVSQDAKDRIARQLGVTSYNSKGFSRNFLCPFHDDTKPSASLHREFGLRCFRCGWKGWKDVARLLGLEWITTKPAPITREIALGDELIQAMVSAGYSVLAYTLETMYRAGWEPGRSFTMKSLEMLGIGTKRARKAFEQMEGRGADRRKQNGRAKHGKRQENICPKLRPFFLFDKEVLIMGKKSKGRPAKTKVLPKPEDLANVFGATVTRYTRIAPKQDVADWRAEVYALPIDHDPGTYPRKKLCKPLGISTTTAQAYDRRANIAVTRMYAPRVQIHNADELPEKPVLKATWLETDDGRRFRATKAGYVRALNYGGRVWKIKQLANDYRRNR